MENQNVSVSVSNEQLVELGLLRQEPSLPAARSVRVGGRGGTKLVQHFTGNLGAKEIKAQLKASALAGGSKLSGKALAARVNEVLRGERGVREQLGVAWVQATIQSGFIPDRGEVGSKSAVLRFVKVAPVVAAKPAAPVKPAAEDLSDEELLAILEARRAAREN